ncbi:restriction endonuclease subunit S [Staphylococcus aureus]|uniref:restriction endonuclease subunit S n=1 Tax=Staphylococcus aureus TaxID=1280 RepID=UPI0039A54BD4
MSNTQKKNVPKLRFPGFEGEWEEKKLEDIIKVNSGKDYKHLDKGDIPVYGTGGYMTSVSEPLSEIDAVGIGRKGTINKPYLLEAPFWTVDTLFYCTPKKETDILFILSLFRKINWKVYDESTGVPSLSKQTINKINRFVPTNKEQQKIGDLFSKLDRQIELEEQKLELLQQQKKGYMQKIFSQELRFKDENGNDYPDWEKKKLKEIACVYTGNTPSKKENIYWNKGEYVWVTPTDINNSKNIYESEHKLTQEGYKKARQLPENTLLVTCIASIGKNAILRKQGSCNQQINAVVPFENINIDYLYYISDSLSTFMKYIAGKTATQIVNKNTFENLEIYLASFEEQNKIADLISSLEELIEKQASKLIKMKSRKQGMLQIMFI